VASFYTASPALFPPTNDIALMSGCLQRCKDASVPPFITLTTPSGIPDSAIYSAIKDIVKGVFSDGLTINVLPVATANGNTHNGIIDGKLNAVKPAHTPSGTLYDYPSISFAMFSLVSPIIKFVVARHCSNDSIPLNSSPFASPMVLPFSAETDSARIF